MINDYLPTSFWMIVVILVVGTSGRFISRVWFTQFNVVRTIFRKILTIIYTLILWVLLIILIIIPLIPLVLPVFIVRLIEEKIYKKKFNCDRLDSDAVTWVYGSVASRKNPSNINGIMIMDGDYNIETLQELVLKKWVNQKDSSGLFRYPTLKTYISSGYFNYYWQPEENFNVKRHVFEWSKTVYSKEQFDVLLNDLSMRPFIRADRLSPWEMILIHYRSEDGVRKSGVFIRAHHALADGVSIVYCFVNYLSDEVALTAPVPKISNWIKLYAKVKGYFYMPLTYLNAFTMPSPSHSLHCLDAGGNKNVCWSQPISLNLIKAIKSKLHVTLNDVLVGCLATNFHRYFKDLGSASAVPNDIVASLPFDTRMAIEEAETLSNKFAVVLFPIPAANDDILKNIGEVHRRMKPLKTSADNIGGRAGMRLANYFLPLIMAKHIHSKYAAQSSLVLSNVPGPQSALKFAGSSVEQICFWPPAKDNLGMSVAILSYNGKIWVTFYCDDALHARSKDFLKGFPDVVNTLSKRVGIPDPSVYA